MRSRTTYATAALALGSVLALGGCAEGIAGGGGQTTILRLALNQAEDHPSFVALDHFSERLEERSQGRLTVDVYANETLGAQAEALQLVSDDIIALAIVSGTQLENLQPDFRVFNMPKVFDDVEHQMRVIHDPDIVDELYSSLEDSEDITVLGGFTQGARHVYASAPVTEPADLAGMKIRVQESPLHLAMVEAMGGTGTPMAFGEVYTALQSGVLDGAENNEVSYVTQKHFEVAPHLSLTNHLVGLDYLIINSEVLADLTEEERALFLEEWEATYTEHTELWARATEEAVADAKAGGAEFHEVDAAAFEEALAPLQEQFLTTPAQQALFDAARAAAGE